MDKSQHVKIVLDAHPDIADRVEKARARKGKIKISLDDAKQITQGVAPVLLASESSKGKGPDGTKRGGVKV